MDLSLNRFIQPTNESRMRVQSSRNFANLPVVMTAKGGGTPSTLDRQDGFAETKWDGTRAILIKKDNETRFYNGRGRQSELTHKYPKVISDSKKLNCNSCILDGEFVFFDARGSQYWLVSSATAGRIAELSLKFKYMVFDILEKDGKNLRNLPIEERKKILDLVVPDNLTIIKETKMIFKRKKEFLEEQLEIGREGVMFKRNGSVYVAGRSDDWIKVKRSETVDVIAKGMTAGEGERFNYFGALKCYLPDGRGGFKYVGKVGGGFTDRDLIDVLPYARSGKPFVIEVKIMEWTRDGKMRNPSFKRLRLDKTIDEVGR